MHPVLQEVVRLRREVALDGAAALLQQGFLDAAQDLLGAAGTGVGLERFTEAQLRIRLAQACACLKSASYVCVPSDVHARAIQDRL